MKISDAELQEILAKADLEYETIKDKAREYDELTKSALRLNEIVLEKEEEIEKLNNIINELEKDINKRIERYDVDETINGIVIGTLKYVLDKLQELKGEDKE